MTAKKKQSRNDPDSQAKANKAARPAGTSISRQRRARHGLPEEDSTKKAGLGGLALAVGAAAGLWLALQGRSADDLEQEAIERRRLAEAAAAKRAEQEAPPDGFVIQHASWGSTMPEPETPKPPAKRLMTKRQAEEEEFNREAAKRWQNIEVFVRGQ